MGIDVGGTHTKAVAIDNATHEIIGKSSVKTTHDDPRGVAAGVVKSFQNCLTENNISPSDVVFVAHRDTRKEGDDTVFIPALREKSYNSIVTELDLLGYLEMKNENGVQIRTITFDPTSRNDGKNTCNLPGLMNVPTILDRNGNPTTKNDFITRLVIAPYLGMIQKKREESAKYDKVMAEIRENIELITDAQSANDFAGRINAFAHVGSSLDKAHFLFSQKVKDLGLVYDKESKTYADKAA